MRPYVAYDSGEKIRCCFFTVVVRNKALANYRGGLKGLWINTVPGVIMTSQWIVIWVGMSMIRLKTCSVTD